MINSMTFNNFAKATMTLAVIAMLSITSVASAASASDVPSCNIFAVPTSITSAQSATLKWISTTGATFASLDNGIGSIAPDGEIVVSPNRTSTYTMHTWNNQGEGGYCSTTLRVNGGGIIIGGGINNQQPNVTLQTVAIHPASSQVTLGNVPYTGAAENILYTLFLLSLLLTAGYAVTTQRKILSV